MSRRTVLSQTSSRRATVGRPFAFRAAHRIGESFAAKRSWLRFRVALSLG